MRNIFIASGLFFFHTLSSTRTSHLSLRKVIRFKLDLVRNNDTSSPISLNFFPSKLPSGPPQTLPSEQQVAEAGTTLATEFQAQEASVGASSQTLELEQQIAGADTAMANESQTQEALVGAGTANSVEPFLAVAPRLAADKTLQGSLLQPALPGIYVPGDNYNCEINDFKEL